MPSGPKIKLGPDPTKKNRDDHAPRVLATDIDVWERQPDETDKAYDAFVEFVAQPASNRTVAEIGKKLGKAATVNNWARKWSWRGRALAWDDHQHKVAREAKLDGIRDMQKRHLKLSRMFQDLVAVELKRMLHHLQIDPENPDTEMHPKLGTREMQKLADFAVRLERLNLGEPESVEEVRTNDITPEEKRRVARKYFGSEKAEEALDILAQLDNDIDE